MSKFKTFDDLNDIEKAVSNTVDAIQIKIDKAHDPIFEAYHSLKELTKHGRSKEMEDVLNKLLDSTDIFGGLSEEFSPLSPGYDPDIKNTKHY